MPRCDAFAPDRSRPATSRAASRRARPDRLPPSRAVAGNGRAKDACNKVPNHRSQKSTLMRSIRRPTKTKRWPAKGSSPCCPRTNAHNPSWPRRRSTGAVARNTFAPGASVSIRLEALRPGPPRTRRPCPPPLAGARRPPRSRPGAMARRHGSRRPRATAAEKRPRAPAHAANASANTSASAASPRGAPPPDRSTPPAPSPKPSASRTTERAALPCANARPTAGAARGVHSGTVTDLRRARACEPAQILRGTVERGASGHRSRSSVRARFFVSESPSHAGEAAAVDARGLHDRAQAVGAWALHVSRPRGCGDDGGGDRRARTVDAARRAGAQAGSERDAVGAGVSRDGLTKSEKSCRRGVDRDRRNGFVMSRERRGQEDVEPE